MLIVGVLLWSAGGAVAGGLLTRWALRGGAAKPPAVRPTDRSARPRTDAAGDERPRSAMVRVESTAPACGQVEREPVGAAPGADATAGTHSPAAPAARSTAAAAQFPRYFGASLAALGLAVTGRLIAPPLGWLALPPLLYSQVPVLRRAWRGEGGRAVALIELASVIGVLQLGYLLLAAGTQSLVLGSHWLVRRAEARAHGRLSSVYQALPDQVWVERGGAPGSRESPARPAVQVELPLTAVQAGDVVIIDAGRTVPVDGVVLGGRGRIDERALTGESRLFDCGPGDMVRASTLLMQGRLRVRVEHAGEDCLAAEIRRILNRSSDYQAQLRARGERVVERGALPTLGVSALALWQLGPTAAVAALNTPIGYPMRYAAPLAALGYLERGARQGVLVKDGRALEQLAAVDTVVFDKTGTLTTDALLVEQVLAAAGQREEVVLTLAASAERRQCHPVALAVVAAAAARGLPLRVPEDVAVETGAGLSVVIDGHAVLVGSDRLMQRAGLAVPDLLRRGRGTALVYVARDGAVLGAVELSARPRPEAAAVIAALRARGCELCILSGDQDGPTRHLAARLGIDRYVARVLPRDKARAVQRLQSQGRRVCFIGDGINDAIALRQADVAVSLAGASTVAVDSAPIVLMDGTLLHLPAAFALADGLTNNLRRGAVLSVAPGVICVGGIFIGVYGVPAALLWYNLSLVAALANAAWPLLDRRPGALVPPAADLRAPVEIPDPGAGERSRHHPTTEPIP